MLKKGEKPAKKRKRYGINVSMHLNRGSSSQTCMYISADRAGKWPAGIRREVRVSAWNVAIFWKMGKKRKENSYRPCGTSWSGSPTDALLDTVAATNEPSGRNKAPNTIQVTAPAPTASSWWKGEKEFNEYKDDLETCNVKARGTVATRHLIVWTPNANHSPDVLGSQLPQGTQWTLH